MTTVQIYVRLLGEAVDVWRPVEAELVRNESYRILDQDYDSGSETWEFEPGQTVLCELIDLDEGRVLAGVRRVAD